MKRNVLVIPIIIALGLFTYWLKCQVDMDIFKSFHLANFLPVKSLQKSPPIVYAQDLFVSKSLSVNKKSDWQAVWMREKDSVSIGFANGHILVNSKSSKDWSLAHSDLLEVNAGDVFDFRANISNKGRNLRASLSVELIDNNKSIIQWHYGRKTVSGQVRKDVVNDFVIPPGVKYIRFRLTGSGIGSSDFSSINLSRNDNLEIEGKELFLENTLLKLVLDTRKFSMTVLDKRSGKHWGARFDFGITDVINGASDELRFTLADFETAKHYKVKISLSQSDPELSFSVFPDSGPDFEGLCFPPVFDASDNALFVLPRSEGLLLNKQGLSGVFNSPLRFKGGWPMPFLGVSDNGSGWMEIVETPNDFEIALVNSKSVFLENRWISEKGKLGYERKIRYVFFDKAGYVDMAKRYREYAKTNSLAVNLESKNTARGGHILKLLGAPDVWYWGKDSADFAKELTRSGIKKCLFSNVQDRRAIEAINNLGFLTSKYDIYQDVWPPIYDDVTKRHQGWPEDLVLDEQSEPITGWVIKKGLREYPGGVICSVPGLERARRDIGKELKDKPYNARFIDTTTSTPWRECFNPKHPTTRSQDLENKMKLLGVSSQEHGLVTGSEDGVDRAVPYVDYFEGMMSIGKGRLPDSGRNVSKVEYMPPTDEFLKYQVGVEYRIPLWELVFHDCVVSTWYWGDSNNRIPEYWWKKDLFNILYGNMPLWAIRDYDHWKQYKTRFIESYNNVCPIFEKVGFLEMTNHRFVTEDRTIQETRFGADIRIFANFNEDKIFLIEEFNYTIPAKGFVVFEKGEIWKEGVCT